jgi:hypothetical protein
MKKSISIVIKDNLKENSSKSVLKLNKEYFLKDSQIVLKLR